MTFLPDRLRRGALLACALALVSALSACGDDVAQPEDPVERARLALRQGDGIAAEADLRRALNDGVDRLELTALMGEAELLQGNLPEAREWLSPGEFSEGTRARGFHLLGQLEAQSGNLAAAGAALDRAFHENPDSPELWVDIGRLRYRGGEQIQAVEAAEKAVSLGPDNPVALHFRAQLVRDAYGMKAAVPWYEAALKHDPENPDILADYAATLGELGRARDMLAAVRKLARVDPGNPQVHYLQAVLAARGGNPVLARALLQRSGNLEREVPAAMLLSAIVDIQNGNHASAAQILTRLADKQPENHRVQELLARALLLGRSDNELIYRYENSALRRGASPYLITLVGRAHEALGQRDKAAQFLDKAAEPRSGNLVAIEVDEDFVLDRAGNENSGEDILAAVRADIEFDRGNSAARRARDLVARFSGSADALSLAGDAELAAGNVAAALERYRASATVRRPWPLTRRMIMTLRADGRVDEANVLLLSHLKGEPNNSEAAAMLASVLADLGRWPEAAAVIDHAIKTGAAGDPRVLSLRARIAATTGNTSLALKLAERSYALQPNNALSANVLAAVKGRTDGDDGPSEHLFEKSRSLARN